MKAADVDAVEIAGSFGYHLKESSLIQIGLLPPEFEGKLAFVGNSSLTGSAAFLMNTSFRSRIVDVAGKIEKLELASDKGFERTFITYLSF